MTSPEGHDGGGMEMTELEGHLNVASSDGGGVRDLELALAIKTMSIKEKTGNSSKTDLLSKLEESRSLSVAKERSARKAAWIAEARKEVIKRREFRKLDMLKVFPELAWKFVLEQLEPKVKSMMSNMSLLWRDVMMNQRTTFLFHAVCPLLLKYESYEVSSREATTVSILKRRLICKEWKNSVDHSVQTPPSFVSLPDVDEKYSKVPIVLMGIEFLPIFVTRIRKFLEWTDTSYLVTGNPFFSRKLLVGMEQVSSRPFWDTVERLLTKWGNEVWQLIIVLDFGLEFADVYDEVCRFLALVPNLRILQIDGNMDHLAYSMSFPTDKNMFAALNARIESRPLPELHHLKTISAISMPVPIVKAMLHRYRSSLENIILGGGQENPNDYCGGATSLHHFKNVSVACGGFALPEGRFLGDNPAVEDLRLIYLGLGKDDPPILFRSLNDFGSSLRKLVLKLHQEFGPLTKLDAKAMKMLSLELPHVEEFSLSISRVNLKTVDFILPMKSLKVLTVVYVKFVSSFEKKSKKGQLSSSASAPVSSATDTDPSGEVIKFGSYINRLYESNIWTLFPELRNVTIRIVTDLKKNEEHSYFESEDEGESKSNRLVKQRIYTREGYKEDRKI